MIIARFLLITFLLFVTELVAQNPAADSLKLVLKRTTNDIDEAKLLNEIASAYRADNPKLMQQYANEALQLSKKIKFRLAEGNAYMNLGNAGIITGDYAKALFNFSNAQTVFESEAEKKTAQIKKKSTMVWRVLTEVSALFFPSKAIMPKRFSII